MGITRAREYPFKRDMVPSQNSPGISKSTTPLPRKNLASHTQQRENNIDAGDDTLTLAPEVLLGLINHHIAD
jgi:hypothetical protein